MMLVIEIIYNQGSRVCYSFAHEMTTEDGSVSDANEHYTRWYNTAVLHLTQGAFVCWQTQLTATLRDASDACDPRGRAENSNTWSPVLR